MGILVTYAFMGKASDDVALENGAKVSDLISAMKEDGVEMNEGCIMSMGTMEATPETELYNGAVVFISEPVFEGI